MSSGNAILFGSGKPLLPDHTFRDSLPSPQTIINKKQINSEETFKHITEEMYKQNLELAVKNKTLSVLKTIYAITMASLDVTEVAQRIVDTIVSELKFAAALITLTNTEQNILYPIAITRSAEVIQGIALTGKSLPEITIRLDYSDNLVVNAIKKRERQITSNILDIFDPQITQEIADEIEKITRIKTLVIYPLYLGKRALGALTIGLSKKIDDLSRTERETLEQLIDLVAIAIDRAQLHADLKSANEKLQELDKLKDEFVSLASHELRTPMTAIKGSLSTILEGYAGDVSSLSKEFLTAAYNENDRLIRLVNNLLNISRIEAGRFNFTMTKVDVDKLITEVVRNLQPAASERSIFLKYEKDGPMSPVWGDEDKVKEVLINLVGNATKFTHKGGITVRATTKDGMIVTSVTDTGSGIVQEDMERLFKKFSQVGGNYARPAGGTGLGLYICKQIVENLKGKIWLESTLGVGSTFYFSLPVAG